MKKIALIFLGLLFSTTLFADHINPKINQAILATKQNVLLFLKQDKALYRVKPRYEKKLKKDFLKHYYSPWDKLSLTSGKKGTIELQESVSQRYLQAPGYNENRYPHTKAWVQGLIAQMQLNTFPNDLHNAITIHDTNLRELPTMVPSFESRKLAGQGFPFDNFQISMLPANVPVYVLQVTKNRAWQLVLTPFMTSGWVQTKNIAPVDKAFIRKWKTKNHVVSVRRHTSISNKKRFFFLSTLGELYPLVKQNSKNAEVLVAIKDNKGNAKITTTRIPKHNVKLWPIPATPHNIARFANQFMGIPYGWGDLYGYLDCSSTTKSLFTAFAIWLPRNSTDQANSGKQISLRHLSPKQKRERIIQSAIPFFTLIHAPGHIMLYIGAQDGHAYVFHNKWGLHTKNPITHQIGRDIIGRTVVMPLNIGRFISDTTPVLQKVDGITYLLPKRYLEKVH